MIEKGKNKMLLKMPPIEKILEAYSAIVDSRIVVEGTHAKIKSSDFSKEYFVDWTDNIYSSNDNASYWKGYIGYPIIAVLMLQEKLPYNRDIANLFKDINWKKMNNEYSNDYRKVVEALFNEWSKNGIDTQAIYREMAYVYSKLKDLKLEGKRSSLRPPQ